MPQRQLPARRFFAAPTVTFTLDGKYIVVQVPYPSKSTSNGATFAPFGFFVFDTTYGGAGDFAGYAKGVDTVLPGGETFNAWLAPEPADTVLLHRASRSQPCSC